MQLDGKIAAVSYQGSAEAYLRVLIVHLTEPDGSVSIGMDMELVWRGVDGQWQYADRADPDLTDAQREILQGEIDWYGNKAIIKYWLSECAELEVESIHFH